MVLLRHLLRQQATDQLAPLPFAENEGGPSLLTDKEPGTLLLFKTKRKKKLDPDSSLAYTGKNKTRRIRSFSLTECMLLSSWQSCSYFLAKCLKHTIRQPRPPLPSDPAVNEFMDSVTTYGHVADEHSTSANTASASSTTSTTTTTATVANSTLVEQYTKIDHTMDPIPRPISPTLSLAPATGLQQEQVNASNEPKTRMASSQRIRRQRRRGKLNLRIEYGMPSSHAQLVAFFVCYISLQLVLMEPEGSAGQWFLILLLQLYAWSVVWSRIRLGRHSVSQVLVGAAIGAVYGMVWFTIWVWRVEDMIKHWQWMDRYGVIQVRKIWRQLEMDEAVAMGRVGGRMYPQHGHFPQNNQFLRL
jgi:hypothetical protein